MDGGWNEGRQRLGVWRSSTGLAPGPSKRTPSFPSHRHLGQAAPGRRRSRLNSIAPTWHPILPVPAAGPLVCLGDSPALGRAPAHPAPPHSPQVRVSDSPSGAASCTPSGTPVVSVDCLPSPASDILGRPARCAHRSGRHGAPLIPKPL